MSDDPAVEAAYKARDGLLSRYISRVETAAILAAAYEAEADAMSLVSVGVRWPNELDVVSWLRHRAAALRGDSA